MTGWPVARKCLVACRLGDSSQQPTCPHLLQMRRCTHGEPVFRHSSQPSALGTTSRIVARCRQNIAMLALSIRSKHIAIALVLN